MKKSRSGVGALSPIYFHIFTDTPVNGEYTPFESTKGKSGHTNSKSLGIRKAVDDGCPCCVATSPCSGEKREQKLVKVDRVYL